MQAPTKERVDMRSPVVNGSVGGNAGAATAADFAALGDRRVPLAVLRERGGRLATALAASGVGEDDSVALLMRNDLCLLEAMIATAQLGAYLVPINWHQKSEEVRFILEDSGAKVLLAHADLLAGVPGAVPAGVKVFAAPTPPELALAYSVPAKNCGIAPDVASLETLIEAHPPMADTTRVGSRGSIVYTSGTTGRPKGVRRFALDPAAARRFGELSEKWFDLRPGIRTVMAGPMYHSAPSTYTRAVLRSGGSIVLMPRFDAEQLLALIERERISHLHMVPTMFVRMLRLPEEVKRRYDTSSLEFVIHGAAPCSGEVKQAMIEWWGPVIHEYYAATETGMVSRSSSAEWLQRPGTVGKAWPGRSVLVYADDGRPAPPGVAGEIYVSLHGVPDFTYQNADAQRAAIDRGGLVTNGDVGYVDEDGYLFLVDRKKDMVISGGVNIYPAEIEGALAMHPAVADSAVIGVPDEEFGEKVAAFVQLVPGGQVTDDALREYLRAKLSNYKIPRMFTFVTQLPRDDSGKLMKRKLREAFWKDRDIKI
jgi:long-chain acyl-CoA synthetase